MTDPAPLDLDAITARLQTVCYGYRWTDVLALTEEIERLRASEPSVEQTAIRALCVEAGMSPESTVLHYIQGAFYALQQLRASGSRPAEPALRALVAKWRALSNEANHKRNRAIERGDGVDANVHYAREASIDACADALEALLPAAPSAVPDWQPIATAPKDGTPVRLRWHGTTVEATGRWCPAHEWPKPFASDDWRDVAGDDVLLMPTHWLPLPAAPEPTKESA